MPDIFNKSENKPNSDAGQQTNQAAQAQPQPAAPQAAAKPVTPDGTTSRFSFFRAMARNPEGITFANQEENEQIKLLLHASLITNIPWVSLTILLLILPPILALVFPNYVFEITANVLPQMIAMVLLFYYLLVIGYAYVSYIIWFYNVSIVSTLHVLDIEFNNIAYKNVDTITLTEIADVSFNQSGFIPTFSNYGTVRIDAEAQNRSIYFENVPKPSYITDYILDLKEGRINNG
ncbi:MAG TPA: hypothetical protein VMR41_02560 [Patescibacteria group bacterium]|nr:hypothetical protein [Patescibacteria group bacterium]